MIRSRVRIEIKMKVLFLTREYPPHSIGGISKHIFWLVKNLKKMGVKCKVLSFGDPKSSTREVFFINPESSVSVYKNSLKHNLRIISDIKKINKIADNIVSKEGFDIIHVEDPYFGPFLKFRNIVTTVHDTSIGEIQSMINNIRTILDIKYFIYFASLGQILEYLTFRKTKKIITVSGHIKKRLIKYYGIKNKKIKVIPNGVFIPDTVSKDVSKKEIGLDADSVLIFSASRLIPRKRLDVLIKAVRILSDNGIKNFYVTICGDGPQKMFLLDLIESYNLGNKITLTGWIPEELLLKYYEAADIFVMPSEYEGMPIGLLEALSYDVVPICSDIPELRQIITDELNGFLFEKGNFKELALKIQRLILDKKMRNFISNNGRLFIKKFDWKNIALYTKSIYEKILEEKTQFS